MNLNVTKLIRPMFGKVCCRQRVWTHGSLHLGFGNKIYHGNSKLIDSFYGEWEMGTYSRSWRVVKDTTMLCGGNTPVGSIHELDAALKMIKLGRIVSLEQPSAFDVAVHFDTGIEIDFLGTISSDDEWFHIRSLKT